MVVLLGVLGRVRFGWFMCEWVFGWFLDFGVGFILLWGLCNIGFLALRVAGGGLMLMVAIFWIFVFVTGVMQFLLASGCAMWFDVHLVWVWVVWIG